MRYEIRKSRSGNIFYICVYEENKISPSLWFCTDGIIRNPAQCLSLYESHPNIWMFNSLRWAIQILKKNKIKYVKTF